MTTSKLPEESNSREKDKFIYPRHRYQGTFTPENLIFNANLQEFAQKVAYICSLETGGKMTGNEAYQEIKALWKEIKVSRKELGIDKKSSPPNQQDS